MEMSAEAPGYPDKRLSHQFQAADMDDVTNTAKPQVREALRTEQPGSVRLTQSCKRV